MKKSITKNPGLKLFSLLLAIVLWLLIVQIEDPVETRPFSNIPVKLVNTELLDRQNKVFEVLDRSDTVRVRVRAPRSVFESLRAGDIVAEADVSKLTDINTVPITYYIQNLSVTYDSIEGDHDTVQLDVEDKKTRWIDLTYNTIGEVADGYMVYSVTPDQNRIEVTGPASLVDTISYAETGIDVSGAKRDLTANVELELFDADGVKVDQTRLTTNVSYIHMAVEVLAVKEVPVEVYYTGEPKEGCVVVGEAYSDPATVIIAGRPAAIENVVRVMIPQEVVDIEGASEDVVEYINLKDCLPENVRLGDTAFNGRATVTVPIESIVERSIEVKAQSISIINIPQELTAELEDATTRYTLTVNGLSDEIVKAQTGTITATVDLKAWIEKNHPEGVHSGVYEIPVLVKLRGDVTQTSEITARIVITAEE